MILGVINAGGSVSTIIGNMTELQVLGHLGKSYNDAISDGLALDLPVPLPQGLLTQESVMSMWVNIMTHYQLVNQCNQAIDAGAQWGLTLQAPDPLTQAAVDAMWQLVGAAEELWYLTHPE